MSSKDIGVAADGPSVERARNHRILETPLRPLTEASWG
jgi:hypothetical protein